MYRRDTYACTKVETRPSVVVVFLLLLFLIYEATLIN